MDNDFEYNAKKNDSGESGLEDSDFIDFNGRTENDSDKVQKSLAALKKFVNTPVNKEFPFV